MKGLFATVAIAMAFAIMMHTGTAFAQEVSVPYGDWISAGADTIADLLTLAIMALFARAIHILPAWLVNIIKTFQVEQILGRAIDYGVNAVEGATKGRKLDISLGNKVLAEAVQYAVDSAPAALVAWMGGEEGIRRKIVGRLDLTPEVTADRLGVHPGPLAQF